MVYQPTIEIAIRPRGQGWREDHREARLGVLLHYDASASDAGSLAWFRDPRAAGLGYHYLVQDNGTVYQLAPYGARVYHAGVCRPSEALMREGAFYRDANSALIGVSISATDGDVATPPQLLAVAGVCRDIFRREGWGQGELWRISGHEDEAWPRGRKPDPTGSDPKHPVLSKELVRHVTRSLLLSEAA